MLCHPFGISGKLLIEAVSDRGKYELLSLAPRGTLDAGAALGAASDGSGPCEQWGEPQGPARPARGQGFWLEHFTTWSRAGAGCNQRGLTLGTQAHTAHGHCVADGD